jgi:hypothetical protein
MSNSITTESNGLPVIVIGAGPACLTASWELLKAGRSSIVLEKDNTVGGLARTVCYKGFRFDIGGHRFFTKVQSINDLWQDILGEEPLVRPRLSRIFYKGRYFDYPLRITNTLRGLGFTHSLDAPPVPGKPAAGGTGRPQPEDLRCSKRSPRLGRLHASAGGLLVSKAFSCDLRGFYDRGSCQSADLSLLLENPGALIRTEDHSLACSL